MERKTVITLNLSTDNQLVIEFRPEVYDSLIVTFLNDSLKKIKLQMGYYYGCEMSLNATPSRTK